MGNINLPYDIENNTDADATEPQGNFQVIESYLNTEVIRRDGQIAMQAQLELVGDPVSANDAVRKSYVDQFMPVGVIMMYGGASAPPGTWALCNGAPVDSAQYPALFAVLAYRYGGTGSSFNLPDLQGRFPMMADTGQFATLGAKGGNANAIVPSHSHPQTIHTHAQAQHVHGADHGHSASAGNDSPDHGHNLTEATYVKAGGGGDANLYDQSNNPGISGYGPYNAGSGSTGGATARHSHSVTVNSTSGFVTNNSLPVNVGDSAAVNTGTVGDPVTNANLPPYQIVNYIIKVA